MIAQGCDPVLVIGYGNTLRGDDAVGRQVVEWFADRALPGVVAISLTQLVPELAARIALSRAVIFVDADATPERNRISVQELAYGPDADGSSHVTKPIELMRLAAVCYDRSPPAWLVAVPGAAFELAECVSQAAHEFVMQAVRAVETLIGELRNSEAVDA